jgi:hypothetical protein
MMVQSKISYVNAMKGHARGPHRHLSPGRRSAADAVVLLSYGGTGGALRDSAGARGWLASGSLETTSAGAADLREK